MWKPGILLSIIGFLYSLQIYGNAPPGSGGAFFLSSGDDSADHIVSIGARGHYAYTLVHTKELKGVRGTYPRGLEFSLNQQLTSRNVWEKCRCFPRIGAIGAWFNYNDPGVLGNGGVLGGYVEPFFWAGKGMDLSLRGTFGGTYLDTPYDPDSNPLNQAYSTHWSFFAQVTLAGYIRLNDRYALTLAGNYNHISNGGVAKPNKGLNYPGISIGVDRTLGPRSFPKYSLEKKESARVHRGDFSFLHALKTIGTDHETLYYITGAEVKYSRQIGSLSALTAGVEWLVDMANRKKITNSNEPGRDHQRGSIAIGHEFLMGRFIFSQQLGYYLYDPYDEDTPFYHRWGLKYYASDRLFLGINLKAHKHIADFFDIRIGYSIQKINLSG